MKVLLGAIAVFALLAPPALAQTTPALPVQCVFTAPPALPDGATATNNAMRNAREAVEAWRAVRATEIAACQSAAQVLQAQAQAAAAAHNAGIAETNATIERFTAENTEYTGRSTAARRERTSATRPDR